MGNILLKSRGNLIAVLFTCLLAGVFSSSAQALGEALDATNMVWTTGGDIIWSGQTTNTHDGIDAASSGFMDSNQANWLETTIVGPVTVSFWTRTESDSFPPISTQFTVNGVTPENTNPEMSPDFPWENQIYDIGDGTNVLRWSIFRWMGTATPGSLLLDEFAVSSPRPLAFAYQPWEQTVFSGNRASFYASAVGTPPIHYQWRKDGTNVADATNQWVSFEQTVTNDGGVYSVTISNAQDFLVSTGALLTVLPPTAPFFVFEPADVTAYSGQSLSLWSAVDGSQPFTYQWRREGTNLPTETFYQLSFTNISLADAGNYTLVVSNALGEIESSNIVVTVIQSIAPVISRHPRSLEVAAGVSTWMEVEASGTPDPMCKWTKEAEVPPPTPPGPLPPLPSFGQNLLRAFTNVSTADAGIYFATASNSGGAAVSRSALLTVLPPLILKGSWSQGAQNIFVTNGLAFLAQGTNGLTILNVSTAQSPQLLGNYDTPGYALAVRVSEGVAYVADGSGGLQILNVNDLSNPFLLSAFNTSGYAGDVIVRSNLAFVASGNAGLVILDVSNPTLPTLVGSYSTHLRAQSICLLDNLAFVGSPAPDILPGTNVAGMLVIDISNPAHPTELGRLGVGIWAMDAKENFVVAASGSSVEIISTSDPAEPSVIGSFNFYNGRVGSVYDVRVVNDLAYTAGVFGGQTQLLVLNIREPVRPIPVGKFTLPGNATSLFVESNLVYVAGENLPVQIIETPFSNQSVAPPSLSLANQNGLKLQCHGGRGFNYTVEQSEGLTGFPWLPVQTILFSDENFIIDLPLLSGTEFFRLKQLD